MRLHNDVKQGRSLLHQLDYYAATKKRPAAIHLQPSRTLQSEDSPYARQPDGSNQQQGG